MKTSSLNLSLRLLLLSAMLLFSTLRSSSLPSLTADLHEHFSQKVFSLVDVVRPSTPVVVGVKKGIKKISLLTPDLSTTEIVVKESSITESRVITRLAFSTVSEELSARAPPVSA